MAVTTPYSRIAGIFLFIAFALIARHFFILFFQALFIAVSIIFFDMKFGTRCIRRMAALIPLLLFIVVFNGMRGGGEVFLQRGPLIVMKQGVFRGLYFALMVMELYLLSRALTETQPERLLSTLHTLNNIVTGKKRSTRRTDETGGLIIMLYYVMRIFYNTYSELNVIFKRGLPVRTRTLLFIRTVFSSSEAEYRRASEHELEIVRPVPGDILAFFINAALLISAVFAARMTG